MTTNPKQTFTLHVEPRHFKGATRNSPTDCGIARAARECGVLVNVHPAKQNIWFKVDQDDYRCVLSNCGSNILRWDAGGPIPPPFTLELPISLLEDALIPVPA